MREASSRIQALHQPADGQRAEQQARLGAHESADDRGENIGQLPACPRNRPNVQSMFQRGRFSKIPDLFHSSAGT